MRRGEYAAWEPAWLDQNERTTIYTAARIPGGVQVNSYMYLRSRTRDGTRVLITEDDNGVPQRTVCEVVCFAELWQCNQDGSMRSARFAIVKRFKTHVRTDQPELAKEQFEAVASELADDWSAVPLECVTEALNCCFVQRGDVLWAMFVPVMSRSNQQLFAL